MKDLALQPPSEKKFGFFFSFVFVFLAYLYRSKNPAFAAVFLGLAVLFAVFAWRAPTVLAPLNLLWFKLGLLLNKFVSPIVLGVLFFAILTPWSLLLRVFGMDLLNLKRKKSLPSYWQEKRNATTQEEKNLRFNVQF